MEVIQNSTFKRGGLFERERGLFKSQQKYIEKRPEKCLEILKNELDIRAIMLNYVQLDIGVIMQKKIFYRTFNQWLFFYD